MEFRRVLFRSKASTTALAGSGSSLLRSPQALRQNATARTRRGGRSMASACYTSRASGGGHRMKIKSPKDFWAGVMFLGTGVFFMVWAVEHYQMGTAVRMGPAYFPTMLGGLLAVLGAIVLFGSLAVEGPPVDTFHFRPLLLISIGCVLYGYLMKPLG